MNTANSQKRSDVISDRIEKLMFEIKVNNRYPERDNAAAELIKMRELLYPRELKAILDDNIFWWLSQDERNLIKETLKHKETLVDR